MQVDSEKNREKFQYCVLDNTYEDETRASLLQIVKRTVERIEKRHSLRTDPKVFLPSVCRRGKLRYDIKLPVNSVKDLSVSPFVHQQVATLLGEDFVARPPHVLVAYSGAEAQDFHTDVDPLFGDDNGDVSHPSFYLTLIAALQDVKDSEMGPTEFYDGKLALLNANQSVLFDGLTVHRGGSASIDRPPLVYQVFHRRWYTDANEK